AGVAAERLARLLDDGEPWLGAEPQLAELGAWMTDPARDVELRRRGCAWLAMFPSVDSARALAAIARDAAAPPPVRDAAIRALGDRELRDRHPSTAWPGAAVQLADEVLVELADAATAAGKITSETLGQALRHVQWEGAAATFARAPGLWGDALECFATPALARVVLVTLEDIPPQHRARAIRLVAAVLGEEAVPMLLARVAQAPLDEKLEMLFAVIALAGESQLGVFEDALRGMRFADLFRQRARWHLRNRGVMPTVRGLRIARATAVIAPAERAAKCAQAADDLGALTRFTRYAEAYLYALWGWMVRGAGDGVRARELCAAHPGSLRLVGELYLDDLARRGRVKQLCAAAQTLGRADLGALGLAIWGRPLAALELATTARAHTPELVCARALACYRAGRPDLTERILAEDLPPPELVEDDRLGTFPGAHERWLIEHAPELRPALAALAAGKDAIVALARPAPYEAEPDAASIEPIAAVTRRLGRALPGATVYLAGEFSHLDKTKLAAQVVAAGARIVNGPFPGTDYYVAGDVCPAHAIAQLERQGARRLRGDELGGG
ncbi:MAG TPA: hypothetical protein VLX92_10920, partial [Kofleriaceae bacterium]|nr:hypothetical protein [Kofleriaceae bacterium]